MKKLVEVIKKKYREKNLSYLFILNHLAMKIGSSVYLNGLEKLIRSAPVVDKLLVYDKMQTLTYGKRSHLFVTNERSLSGIVLTSSKKI